MFSIGCNAITCPPNYDGMIGVALVSSNDIIKEILKYEIINTWSDVENDYILSGTDHIFPDITITQDIDSNDRLQLVYKQDNTDDWKLVLGTIEAPSHIAVNDVKSDVSVIHISIKSPDALAQYYKSGANDWIPIQFQENLLKL